MEKKTLLITEKTHILLKDYCKQNSIKINDWVEKLILIELKKRNDERK
jgi:hypothetical protein